MGVVGQPGVRLFVASFRVVATAAVVFPVMYSAALVELAHLGIACIAVIVIRVVTCATILIFSNTYHHLCVYGALQRASDDTGASVLENEARDEISSCYSATPVHHLQRQVGSPSAA